MKYLYFAFLLLISNIIFAAETKFFVDGMTCPSCASSVENAFKKVDGYSVESVQIVSLPTGEVIVKTRGDKILSENTIKEELKETGFTLRSISISPEN